MGLLGSMEGRSEKFTLEEERRMIREWREGCRMLVDVLRC